MIKPTLQQIREVMKSKGYVYYNGPKPNDLNIIGIRTANREANVFDDWITVSGRNDQGREFINYYAATTDPGVYWLKNPINIKGTAILIPGQYKKVYKIGYHGHNSSSGPYPALEQIAAMTYVRDNDRDSILDIEELMKNKENFLYDNIKSNIHRANARVASTQVDKWSAACQVMAEPDRFDEFIELCRKGAENYGNCFSYTLLEEKDFVGL